MHFGHPRLISEIRECIQDPPPLVSGISEGLLEAPYQFEESAIQLRTHPIFFWNHRLTLGHPTINLGKQSRNSGHPRAILGISDCISDTPAQFYESRNELRTSTINFRTSRIDFMNKRRNSGHLRSILGPPSYILGISEGIQEYPDQVEESTKAFKTHSISLQNQRMQVGHSR